MRRKKNVHFRTDAVQHIYQRAVDHGVIFYSLEDRLVYYTLAASKARKHHITVILASIMFTHIHQSVQTPSLAALRSYLHDLNSAFSRLYNFRYSRDGQLFERPIGHSQKVTSKDKRSNYVYIANNHVEKRLCNEAMQERWSFLAYAASDHPFSKSLSMEDSSKALQKAIRLADRRCLKLKSLEYSDLERILPSLNQVEYEQFIDYVISRFAWIDFSKGIAMFGGLSNMITAVNSTTGGEYDISEDYDSLPDKAYVEMTDLMARIGKSREVYSMNMADKSALSLHMLKHTSASIHHIRKFFHED